MENETIDGEFELLLLESKTSELPLIDVVTRMTNQGISQEIVMRLETFWEYTMRLGDKIVSVGKIIVGEIMRFIDENPHLAFGAALGAAVGSLINMIPIIGSALTPLAMALGAFVGGIAGSRLDRGKPIQDGWVGIAQEIIVVAKKFFEFIASVFNAVCKGLSTS